MVRIGGICKPTYKSWLAGRVSLLLSDVLSHRWVTKLSGSFYKRLKQRWCRKVADLEIWQIWGGWNVCSHTVGAERSCQVFCTYRLQSSTQVSEVPNCPWCFGILVELGIKSGATRQTPDYEPNAAWHTADHFSAWKLSSLFRNTVLQRLNLNTTPGLRITEGGAGVSSHGCLAPGESSALEMLSVRCNGVQEKALWIQTPSPLQQISNAFF